MIDMEGPNLWDGMIWEWPGCIKNVKQEASWKREIPNDKCPMISEYVMERDG